MIFNDLSKNVLLKISSVGGMKTKKFCRRVDAGRFSSNEAADLNIENCRWKLLLRSNKDSVRIID